MSALLPVLDSNKPARPREQYVVVGPEDKSQDNDDEIDLRELLLVLRRNKGTIIVTTLLVFLTAFFITLKIQPTYKATTTIQIESEQSAKVLNFDVGISGDSANSEFFQTQYELLKSRALASKVIKQLNINPENITPDKSLMSRTLQQLRDLVSWGENSIRYDLGTLPPESSFLDDLSISPVKKSQIVAISYTSEDPQFATNAANAVAENFIEMTRERREKSGSNARSYIQDKLASAESELNELEQGIADYAKQESIIQTGGENSQSLIAQRTAELNIAFAHAETARIQANAEYQQLLNSTSTNRALNNPTIQAYKSSIVQFEHEYQQKLQIYKPGYPQMRSLKRQINELKAQLSREISVVTSTSKALLKDRYYAAKQKEDEIKAILGVQKNNLLEQRDKGIQYSSLLRDINIKRKVYEDLLLRSIEINIASGVATSNIAIVDPAILPFAPQKPNVKLNLALGAVLGLFLGIVIAFLLEFMDDRVKSSDELKRLLGLALLGITPSVKGKDPITHSLATALQPTSAIAESFRSLRTNLLFSSVEGVPKAIALTSSMPSEGKSSSCLNLATAFAQADSKVLLVDADMRKPTIHKRLKLDNSQGLSNFLTHQSDIGDVVQTTIIDGVSVITAGPLSPNPSELLSSKRIEDIFQLAPNQFDLIIIDCPPVMGLADALILANKADATILVSAFGQTSKRAILDTHERLKQARANMLGVVFSKVKSGGGSGYSYEYSSYYSYGADRLKEEGGGVMK